MTVAPHIAVDLAVRGGMDDALAQIYHNRPITLQVGTVWTLPVPTGHFDDPLGVRIKAKPGECGNVIPYGKTYILTPEEAEIIDRLRAEKED